MARMSICSSSMEVFGRRKLIRPVIFSHLASVRDRGALVLGAAASAAMAQAQGPEALVNQLSNEMLEAVRADKAIQSGDLQRVIALVDAKAMPHVDAEHIMASHRRSAPPASMATAVSADAHMEALRRIERGTLHEAPEDPLLAYLPHAARRLRRATRPGAARSRTRQNTR